MTTWTPTQSGSAVPADFATTRSMGFQFLSTNPVIGSGVTKAQFRLFSPSTPNTYLIYCKIYSSSGTLEETSATTVQANTIGSTALFTWNFSGTHAIVANDYIAIEPGDGSLVRMNMSNTSSDPYQGVRQDIGTAATAFSPLRYPDYVEITYGTPTPPATGGTRLPPPPLVVHF